MRIALPALKKKEKSMKNNMLNDNGLSIKEYLSRFMISVLFLAVCATAVAQESDSLAVYLKEAAGKNPGLKVKYSNYLAALEKIPQAGALPDPEMQFSFFITPMELMTGRQVADLRVMQMSPWFGTLKAAREEASKMALAKFQEAESYKNELFLEVKTSWYQVFRAKQEIASAEKNLAILRSLERMALVRFKAALPEGSSSATATDGTMGGGNQGGMVGLLRVQMEIGILENRIESLKDMLITAQARFNGKLNRKSDSVVFIPESLRKDSLPGSLVQMADSLANNPMIRMYEADSKANEARMVMATRMGYPMVGAGLNYSLISKTPNATFDMNGRDMIMPMFTATLPVYRKKYDALRREAGYLRDAAAESARNVKIELTVNLKEAIQLYNDAVRRVNLFEHQATLAEKTITLLTRSFSVAGSDFEEILRMQQQLLDYEFKQIEALVDLKTAIATVMFIISYK
jgi:outer membrane protein TolC